MIQHFLHIPETLREQLLYEVPDFRFPFSQKDQAKDMVWRLLASTVLLGKEDKIFTRLGSKPQVSHLPVVSQTPCLVLLAGQGGRDLVSLAAGRASTGRIKQKPT